MEHNESHTSPPAVNETRRQLTKTALATPVVLATLSSRNALATNVPYKCTISGKLSNNTSAPGGKSCTSLGKSCDGWKQSYWNQYKKGTCVKRSGQLMYMDEKNKDYPNEMGACMKDISRNGKKFNAFYCRKKGSDNVWRKSSPSDSKSVHLTLYEVLCLDSSSGFSDYAYAREIATAFLNSVECAPDFPVKPEEVIAMFNATCNGGTYQVKDGVSWGATQVCNYLSSLHT